MSSGDGFWKASVLPDEPNMSWTLIEVREFPAVDQVEIARPNAVGGALRSGKGSCSTSGSGSGSGGGGVDSRLFLEMYFRGSGAGMGATLSFWSVDLPSVKRSSALVVFCVSLSPDGCAKPCLIASAFFLRSSASFANLLEPPRIFGAGR